MQELVLSRPRVLLQTRSASETGHRLSARPGVVSRRGEDLPGYWAVLFVRAVVATPRRIRPLLAPTSLREDQRRDPVIAFRENRTLGIRKVIVFEAVTPRLTRSRAYASPASVTKTVARLTTGSGGLTPEPGGIRTRWTTDEISWSHRNSSNPNRPAEPGRTAIPIRRSQVLRLPKTVCAHGSTSRAWCPWPPLRGRWSIPSLPRAL